jgi:hypothetical protein
MVGRGVGHDAGAGWVSARAIGTEAELRAALEDCGAAEIVLGAGEISVNGALVLGRSVTLRGTEAVAGTARSGARSSSIAWAMPPAMAVASIGTSTSRLPGLSATLLNAVT